MQHFKNITYHYIKIKIKILTLLVVLLVFASCKQVFNVEHPGGKITPDQQWGNPDFIKGYVTNFYSILPSWNRDYDISGEAFGDGSGGNSLNSFLKGTNNSQSGDPDEVWD